MYFTTLTPLALLCDYLLILSPSILSRDHDVHYSLSDTDILDTDLRSCFTESHCLALALINKNQPSRGYWGRLVAEDQGGMLGRATPHRFGCRT